jgi:capsular exopolysaccharide synthesis family protein
MSKIFEALQKTQVVEGVALSSLIDECALVEPVPVLPEPAGSAVTRLPMITAATSAEAIPHFPALDDVRVLPLRISSPSALLPFDKTHWYAGEQYRLVRTKILQHPMRPRVIVVSSASSGDGKTVSAINVAGALSLKADSKVVLVDGDFRRPSIHSQLGLPSGPGLSDVLKGTCTLGQALVRTAQFPNLYVLAAGDSTTNPTELLDSPRWHQVCADIRSHFGFSIIDSPPVGKVADYDLLQAACDAVVMIIRPDHTNRKPCFKALKMISQQKFLGVLLNCTERWFLMRSSLQDSAYYYLDNK